MLLLHHRGFEGLLIVVQNSFAIINNMQKVEGGFILGVGKKRVKRC
jgi:hypothetical protein